MLRASTLHAAPYTYWGGIDDKGGFGLGIWGWDCGSLVGRGEACSALDSTGTCWEKLASCWGRVIVGEPSFTFVGASSTAQLYYWKTCSSFQPVWISILCPFISDWGCLLVFSTWRSFSFPNSYHVSSSNLLMRNACTKSHLPVNVNSNLNCTQLSHI